MEFTRKFRLVSIDGERKVSSVSATVPSSVLVPPTALSLQNVHASQAQKIGEAMSNTLKRRDLTDAQKLLAYNQQQYEYMNHKREMSKHVRGVNFQEYTSSSSSHED